MKKLKDPKSIANYLLCLSKLENNTSLLYKILSEKVEIPLAKTLLSGISIDSSKHSGFLKSISYSISDSKQKTKDCFDRLGKTWLIVETFLEDVTAKPTIGKHEFSDLVNKLVFFGKQFR